MKSNFNSLRVETAPIDSLHISEQAIVRHPAKQLEKAAKFLASFGQVPAVLAAPDGEILYWDEIWLALKASGATHVSVAYVQNQSKDELSAIRVGLRRIPRDAKFRPDNLRIVLDHLAEVNFDLELTGFEKPEIAGYVHITTDDDDLGNELTQINGTAASVPGSVWRLDRHHLVCGKAINHEMIERVMQHNHAACAFANPQAPSPLLQTARDQQHAPSSTDQRDQTTNLDHHGLTATLLSIKQLLKPDGLVFSCAQWHQIMAVTTAGHAAGLPLIDMISVIRPPVKSEGFYRGEHDLVCLFGAGALAHPTASRSKSNVWQYRKRTQKLRKVPSNHRERAYRTTLVADILRDTTFTDDLVLASDLTYGCALIAAETTSRVCIGLDPDPHIIDAAICRWEGLTGGNAILLESGMTFKELQKRNADRAGMTNAQQ